MSELEISAIAADFASGSDKNAEKAAHELAAFGSHNLDAYTQLLIDQRVDVRWWAVRSLAENDSPDVISLLLNSLDDADISVRQCAALALQGKPDHRAIPHLILLLDSSDQLLGRLAGDALIAAGNDAVPALLEVLGESRPKARIEAMRALTLIGDTRAIPEMFKALDGDSALLEHWASEGLEKMGVGMVFYSP
jgi:HEAT repeat protein